jgi:glycosyltransferase involved in cell wall biosynthesis
MNIGFDAKRYFHNHTGLGNYSRSLIAIFEKYLTNNHYFLYNLKKKKTFKIPSNSKNVSEINPTKFWKIFKNLWRQIGIYYSVKNNKLDIFHGLSGELPWFLPKNVKKIVTIHDLIFVRYPKLYNFLDRKIYYYKFKFAAQKADVVVAISEQTKADIVEFLKINPDKIKVIYQGCSSEFKQIYSEIQKNNFKEKYQLPDKFLLNVGTIEARKNLLNIVKSIQNTEIPLVVVGKKTKYFFEEVEPFIKKNKMENQVIYLKNLSREDLAILYQLATIFIYPSVFEGFGIPIIEAMYSKTLVITTKNGVFPESAGPNSIFIDPNNADDIKNNILDFWNNEQEIKNRVEKSFQFVQKFNDDVLAKQWEEIYEFIS